MSISAGDEDESKEGKEVYSVENGKVVIRVRPKDVNSDGKLVNTVNRDVGRLDRKSVLSTVEKLVNWNGENELELGLLGLFELGLNGLFGLGLNELGLLELGEKEVNEVKEVKDVDVKEVNPEWTTQENPSKTSVNFIARKKNLKLPCQVLLAA